VTGVLEGVAIAAAIVGAAVLVAWFVGLWQ
jgi:hypothetical protein